MLTFSMVDVAYEPRFGASSPWEERYSYIFCILDRGKRGRLFWSYIVSCLGLVASLGGGTCSSGCNEWLDSDS
jgi:hypothetical protein